MKKNIILILAFGLFVLYVVLKTKDIYALDNTQRFEFCSVDKEIDDGSEFIFPSEFDGDIISELVDIFGVDYQYVEWDEIVEFELTEDINIDYMLENIREEAIK